MSTVPVLTKFFACYQTGLNQGRFFLLHYAPITGLNVQRFFVLPALTRNRWF